MQLFIREATEDDLPEILSLYHQPDMDSGDTLSLAEAKTIFHRMATYPSYKLYIAKMEEETVGTFALAIMDNLAHRGTPSGLIEDVVVKADCQGKGIGRQMMQFAMDCCKKSGCYKAALSSNMKRENAHHFYESLGFTKHGYSFLMDLN